jgi:hydrogenase maturation protease
VNEQDWRLLDADRSVEELRIDGWLLQKGERVLLRPRARGDVFDLTLAGKTAQVESIEQDLEGNFLVAVVLEEDPGAYLGLLRMPGHRFFFTPQELERLPPDPPPGLPKAARTILVAGIGNIFLGDDGFGVEVAHRLAGRRFPDGVTVTDYGIRGYDLAYALVSGTDYTILVDTCPRGEPPGTVFVLEPDLAELDTMDAGPAVVDAHDLNPLYVLRLAKALGAELTKVVVVGCEPSTLGPPEGHMGLSDPVRAAVDEAVTLIEGLIEGFNTETGDCRHGIHPNDYDPQR